MSIWNKILVGLIGVAALGLFIMAARTLKTHQYWRDLALQHQRRIAQVEAENVSAETNVRQLRVALDKLLLDRRRAWFNCAAKVNLNRQDGSAAVAITTDQPDPNGIAQGAVLYGFEATDVQKKGRYLGEFKVTKSDEKQKTAILVPAAQLSARQMDRLATAKGPWELYEILPRDNHDVFASLNDAEKKALLPKGSWPDYLKDGQPAAKDDPADRVVDGKYVRPIRDYQVLLGAQSLAYTLLTDRIIASMLDAKLVEDALAQAQQQEEAAKADVALSKEDLANSARQRDAVKGFLDTLDRELTAVKAAITELIKANTDMAGRIAKSQLEAARRIDQRTRAMAQSGAGGQ